MLETMKLEELKEILEKETKLDFEIKEQFGSEKILVKGLKKEFDITIDFSRYSEVLHDVGGKRFISCGWRTKDEGASAPCDSVEKATDFIFHYCKRSGMILPTERYVQNSLF